MESVRIAAAQYSLNFLNDIQQWQKKTQDWVEKAVQNQAQYLLFPEYASIELTSLLPESDLQNLPAQAKNILPFLDIFKKTFQDLAQKNKIYIIAPSFPVWHSPSRTTNRVFIFTPKGQLDFQDKFFMTRFEDEQWAIQSGENKIKVFQTKDFNFSISTCFDIEFSFPATSAVSAGAQIIFAPSCTETVKGANRVHIGARARALENQCYTVVSQTVGQAKWSLAVDENYGFAGFYSTPDVGFPDDGILLQGPHNIAQWVYQDLRLSHLEKVRKFGAVFNYKWAQKVYAHQTNYFTVEKVVLAE